MFRTELCPQTPVIVFHAKSYARDEPSHAVTWAVTASQRHDRVYSEIVTQQHPQTRMKMPVVESLRHAPSNSEGATQLLPG
jgi:hypothetical protein